MRIRLPEHWTKYLISKPESGMGFQRVDIELDDGTHLEDCIVFNGEDIEVPPHYIGRTIQRLTIRGE